MLIVQMRYPGYLLNPGDMFQVEPDRVMFATGASKDKQERRAGRVARRQGAKEEGEKSEEGAAEEKEGKPEAEEKGKETEEELDPKESLKSLMSQAKSVLASKKGEISAKRKQDLRGFQRAVRRVLSRSESSTVLADNLEAQFAELTSLLKAKRAAPQEQGTEQPRKQRSESTEATESDAPTNMEATNQPGEALTEAFKQATLSEDGLDEDTASELSDDEFDILKRALTQVRDNPIDHTKPYATPWRPRAYMSPFAFIPRYLEVNQNICAAVYLRHPVVRPGLSELPTPFPEEVSASAYLWYLRRR